MLKDSKTYLSFLVYEFSGLAHIVKSSGCRLNFENIPDVAILWCAQVRKIRPLKTSSKLLESLGISKPTLNPLISYALDISWKFREYFGPPRRSKID